MDPHKLHKTFLERQSRHKSTPSVTDSPDDITPFPIRLIYDHSSRSSSPAEDPDPVNDQFYRFWHRFLAASPGRTPQTSALARRLEQTTKAAGQDENGLHTQASPAASYDQAKNECQAKVQAIVAECKRLNQKYRDRLFDLELRQVDCIVPLVDLNDVAHEINPSGVKRIQNIFTRPVFNPENACSDDVMQGSLGDCWFLAALSSVSAKPNLMQRLCVARDEVVGVYGFVFFRDGEWIPEVIDDRLFIHVNDGDDVFVGKYVEERKTKSSFNSTNDISKLRESLQKGGEALFFARCRDSEDTWLPLIEKAYAKAHGDYGSLHGGWIGEGMEDLTGGVSVHLNPTDVMDKDLLWKELMEVNETYLFAGGANHYRNNGQYGKHAYAVLQAVEHKELRLLKIRNPWGNNKTAGDFDGPFNHKFEEWSSELVEQLKFDFKDPGVFWVTLENFLRYFESIIRTRLFDPTWTLTQQWTSVNVSPVTTSYLPTAFHLTLSHATPVVIVLAQPDVTYFQGLQGRYLYSLHFRIYDSKDMTKYLARSMNVSSSSTTSTRSVSIDLSLPAGDYTILVKVSPTRRSYPTAESIIETQSPHRKQKLLQAGRNFELAMAKGKLREKETENRKEKKDLARKEFRDRQANCRKLRQRAKARKQLRKERIAEEKRRRERTDLLQRANALLPPPPPGCEMVVIVEPPSGYVGTDFELNAELEDDDFMWDSSMDGDVFDSESDEEKDWFADDPWQAVCVLGLRVYSQVGDVAINVREHGIVDYEAAGFEDVILEIIPPEEDTGDVVEKKAKDGAGKSKGKKKTTKVCAEDKTDKDDVKGPDVSNIVAHTVGDAAEMQNAREKTKETEEADDKKVKFDPDVGKDLKEAPDEGEVDGEETNNDESGSDEGEGTSGDAESSASEDKAVNKDQQTGDSLASADKTQGAGVDEK